jgi:hypothetical protein
VNHHNKIHKINQIERTFWKECSFRKECSQNVVAIHTRTCTESQQAFHVEAIGFNLNTMGATLSTFADRLKLETFLPVPKSTSIYPIIVVTVTVTSESPGPGRAKHGHVVTLVD